VNIPSGNVGPTYDNSLVQGLNPGGTNLDGTTAMADFVAPEPASNAPTTAGDYRLQETSDAIDAGDNTADPDPNNSPPDTMNDIPDDLAGNPRIVNTTIDLGAYEYRPPQTFYVDAGASGANDGSSWADAYTDLNMALTSVISGDQVWVTTGVYTPGTTRSDTFQLVSGVQIYGGFSPGDTQLSDRDPDPATNGTVLSGDIGTPGDASDNVYHVVTASGVTTGTVLDGFTIEGGYADGGGDDDDGGGIFNDGGSPTLQNLIIQDNFADSNGGAIYVFQGTLTMTAVTMSDNFSDGDGGGLYSDEGILTLTDVTISGNEGDLGGGMHHTQSNATLTNVRITNNESSGNGGGINNRSNSTMTITNAIIQGNSVANSSGGGIYNEGNSQLKVTDTIIQGNQAATRGGGMYNSSGFIELINVLITGNTADDGGGLYNSSTPDPVHVLTNVTIAGNQATTAGGGILNTANGSLVLENSIIHGNAASTGDQIANVERFGFGGDTITVTTTLVEGGIGGPGVVNEPPASIVDDGGNLSGDPLFTTPISATDAPTTTGDFQVQVGSPVIDAGDNAANSSATDLAGNTRIVDGDGDSTATIDLGVYEAIPDTTAPNPPVVTGGPTIETDDPTPPFSGTAEPGSTITVVIDLGGGESVTYETTADGNGDWSIDLGSDTPTDGTLPSEGLGTDSYPVSITATDAADNASTPTALTLTITAGPADFTTLYLPFVAR
jgi:hypothetical protein